jgi:alkanesulfonate monooxygenase SsuD/methylene tetrahydromethanopterin reductase-like flavin-dependent oxidoreductase (luciferase family)
LRFGLSPIQSDTRFDAMLRQAELAEELGYDVLWAHEHHAGAAMYPSPLMTLAALASRTRRIGLETNMLLLPLHHPLRVAEDGAMVDVLSGGRLRLGVSAGYAEADLRAFAVPAGERAGRMRDGLTLIRAVWTGEHVNLENSLSQLADFTMFPRPVQQPAPPIFVGGTVDAAIRRAARLGDELLISTTQRLCEIPRILDVYHAELRRLGKDPAQKSTALNRIVHVIPDGSSKILPWSSSPVAFCVFTTPGGIKTSPSLGRRPARQLRSTPTISSSAKRPNASTGSCSMPRLGWGRSPA